MSPLGLLAFQGIGLAGLFLGARVAIGREKSGWDTRWRNIWMLAGSVGLDGLIHHIRGDWAIVSPSSPSCLAPSGRLSRAYFFYFFFGISTQIGVRGHHMSF